MNDPKKDSLSHLFEGLLKSPSNLIEDIREDKKSCALLGKLLIITLVGFLIFGVTLGSFAFHEQLWATPSKSFLESPSAPSSASPASTFFQPSPARPLG